MASTPRAASLLEKSLKKMMMKDDEMDNFMTTLDNKNGEKEVLTSRKRTIIDEFVEAFVPEEIHTRDLDDDDLHQLKK